MDTEFITSFLQVTLTLSRAVQERTGIDPLLSRATYDYGISEPAWDWSQIDKQVEALQSNLDGMPAERRPFLRDCLAAFALMVREGQGEDISYAERVSTYLQVPGEPVDSEIVKSLEDKLRALFVEAGYPDDLSRAIPQWRERQAVHGEMLVQKGQSFLKRARAETKKRIYPLPPGHKVTLTFPHDYPYRGYSDYSRDYQGQVFLNGDIEWELATLKHVVCHEAFPGHQAFSAIREHTYRAGTLPIEGTIYFANTPITPIVEGMCEIGQEALGMLETPDDQIYDVYNRFTSAVCTNLAVACNVDGMDRESAVSQLMQDTHVPRGFAEIRYDFWTHPLWCTSFPHYWYGRELMRDSYSRMKNHLPVLYEMVYIEPHSVRTLREAIDVYLTETEQE